MLSEERVQLEIYNAVGDTAFFRRLVAEWSNFSNRTDVYNAVSDADYRAAKTPLARLRLRWRMYPGYALHCWKKAQGSRDAIRIVATNPFFAPGLVARASRGTGATINLLYDLYPDALIQAGQISPNGWAARRLAKLTRHSLQSCDATVFLGERLRAYAESQYGAARFSAVIPVGADGDMFKRDRPGPHQGPVRILYCGQLGRMHDYDTIAPALEQSRSGVTFAFRSSGAGYRRLQQRVGDRRDVRWGGSLPDREWAQAMRDAQIALVTIAPGAERVVMPSKTYSALVAGQAVLAICPRESDLADLVLRHDCGWVIEPGEVGALGEVLRQIANGPELVLAKRTRAYDAGHAHYDMAALAGEWGKLFERLQPMGNRRTSGALLRA